VSNAGNLLGGLRRELLTVGVFSFFLNMLLLTGSLYMIQVFDRVLSAGRIETLVYLTLVAAFALAVYGLLEALRGRMLSRLSAWVDVRLSPEILRASQALTLRGGDMGTRGLSDLSQIRAFVGGNGINALFDAPWLPLFLTVIFLMNPWLGLVSLGGAVVLFALALLNEAMTRAPLRRTREASIRERDTADAMVRNAESVRALGMGQALLGRWGELHAETLSGQGQAEERTAVLLGVTKFARQLLQILLLGVGAWLVLRNELTGGGMIAASILLGRALSPVEQAISAWKQFVAARSGWRSVERLLSSVPPEGERTSLPAPAGRLLVEGVSFQRRQGEPAILRQVSFELLPGSVCALMGPSGSGKSSLCRLLVGAWRPTQGTVRLDGADIARWSPEELGRHVGYVPQGMELFAGTVADNIARMEAPDSARVVEAARLAGAHDMILRLPDGYETDIGRFGERLSAGQRQRVALARALYGDPRLLVLDEPNANLDSEGEEALAEALLKLRAMGRTVLVVTHRTGLLRACDQAAVIEAGALRLFGPIEQVMARLTRPKVAPIRPAPAPGPVAPPAAAAPPAQTAATGGATQ
jgi:PrtD family type I secretion system ABC transporter